jgi:hypothetical protein
VGEERNGNASWLHDKDHEEKDTLVIIIGRPLSNDRIFYAYSHLRYRKYLVDQYLHANKCQCESKAYLILRKRGSGLKPQTILRVTPFRLSHLVQAELEISLLCALGSNLTDTCCLV